MAETTPSYPVKRFEGPTRRIVRTLCLRDDPRLIEEYRRRHAKGNIWPEIIDGIRRVGILEMEIYIHDTTLTMIMEVPADWDADKAMAMLATLPRQQEWEDFMSSFQSAGQGSTASEKWKDMTRMFYLYDSDDQ